MKDKILKDFDLHPELLAAINWEYIGKAMKNSSNKYCKAYLKTIIRSWNCFSYDNSHYFWNNSVDQ